MDRITEFTHGALRFDVTDTGPLGAPVVLLLHGFPQRNTCWTEVSARLNAAGYRTLAPDQRGYSPRARPRGIGPYRLSGLVDDVLSLVERVGAQVHLVGHDWGANVAWATAAAHPEAIRTLTALSVGHPRALVAAMRRPQQFRKSWYMLAFQVPWLPERILRGPRGRAALARSGMDQVRLERYHRELVTSGALTPAINWYRALVRRDRRGGYGRSVRVPTSYLWSTGDTALGREAAHATAQYVTADYRYHEVPGSHWLPDQQPDLVAEVILDRIRTRAEH